METETGIYTYNGNTYQTSSKEKAAIKMLKDTVEQVQSTPTTKLVLEAKQDMDTLSNPGEPGQLPKQLPLFQEENHRIKKHLEKDGNVINSTKNVYSTKPDEEKKQPQRNQDSQLEFTPSQKHQH